MKNINRYISVIESKFGLIFYSIFKRCDSCNSEEFYVKYDSIDPETGKWKYRYMCSYCGKEK